MIGWLRQWMGLPAEFGGVIYDTASVGVMHALAVAREEAAPSTRKLGLTSRGLPRFRIYTSDQAHSSAEKAAIALGLGEENGHSAWLRSGRPALRSRWVRYNVSQVNNHGNHNGSRSCE